MSARAPVARPLRVPGVPSVPTARSLGSQDKSHVGSGSRAPAAIPAYRLRMRAWTLLLRMRAWTLLLRMCAWTLLLREAPALR